MPDWTKSMEQTFEYYTVDPGTWKDVALLTNVKTSTINRDSEVETLGSASFDVTETVGESYIRVYLITVQNGIREKHALGTFLVQTPSSSFDGRIRNVSMDAYTPLLELKENRPPLGYFIPEDANVMEIAYRLARDHMRAPVVRAECPTKNVYDFIADPNDTWLSYISAFIANQLYDLDDKPTVSTFVLDLDEMGRLLFAPKQDTASLQPVWTYGDDDNSILHSNVTMDHDLYGIPNVVEVVYGTYYARVVNDDENSPISTVNRGREITYRVTDPDLTGNPTQLLIDQYAEQLLKSLSTVEYTVTYTHGYCPVRLGDCVRLNYTRAGLTNIKAKVISQSIKCEPGCPVTEKAKYTAKLWR